MVSGTLCLQGLIQKKNCLAGLIGADKTVGSFFFNSFFSFSSWVGHLMDTHLEDVEKQL